ncbi:MAG: hypothetical protein AAF602_31425, partial [Myxococcota bacterium]
MTLRLVLLIGLAACGRKQPPPQLPPVVAPPPDAATPRLTVDGGSYWTEPGGLCLEVPDDWGGTSGSAPHLLALRHVSTDTEFDVFAWASDLPEPQMGDAWLLEFEDADGYRTVPILSPAATATWRTRQSKGRTRTTWRGAVGKRRVRVQATFAFGQSVQGLDEVE